MNNQKKIILAAGVSGTLLVGSLYYVFANRAQSPELLVKEETVLKEALQSSPAQTHKEDDHTDYTQQVVLKIKEDGYVTAHGDHEHFIKGPVPFDAIYLKSLVVDDPNYVLNKADIVSEIKDGYVIKYDGKYRIYLKDGDLAQNVRSQEELLEIRRNVRTRASGDHGHSEMASGHDNYQFRPEDVVSETEDGYIVKHGDHFHYIEKSKVQGNGTQVAAGNPMARPNGPVADAHEEERFVFDRNNIISETETGYVVQHGNHTHFVFKKMWMQHQLNRSTMKKHPLRPL
ncbi:pneumococcal-type histidine triad protein [Granulicatella seriolae]|uniref:Pneumococcal-type histidine triad protein n=1 Tax=Granulicatella seriolae TaxID=2967226 RepID=A0ABT1WRK0_9LACT|nr:pneumococcal-type histidine triad protein [Granulicatella seriolae]